MIEGLVMPDGERGRGRPPQVHFIQGAFRLFCRIRTPSYVGPGEQIVTCHNGYSFARKCFAIKCARPSEIDDRVFLPKSPGPGTPEV